jgi:hypothetical protein
VYKHNGKKLKLHAYQDISIFVWPYENLFLSRFKFADRKKNFIFKGMTVIYRQR